MIFFREYYGLVINVLKIASHKLVPTVQDIRRMETTLPWLNHQVSATLMISKAVNLKALC